MADPANLRYTENHQWVEIRGSRIRVGLTEYGQERLSDITHVELPEPDDHHYEAHEEIGLVESLKMAAEFRAPVAGKIVAVNSDLFIKPELINQDPYGDGWLVEMIPDDMGDVKDLMDLDEYEAGVPEEEEDIYEDELEEDEEEEEEPEEDEE
ncbi:MAG: glycine cleavage system protein GcvH [Kiritimatiellae bacterium]|nr:glycine cleavage system protein GcvH [Kiritimatiellia bacterium]